MTTEITVHPSFDPGASSPYQQTRGHAPNIVNDEFFGSFADFIDMINPLQHIPVVSNIYRAITGDEISPGARFAGDALFNGPIGLFTSIANAIIEDETGRDIGSNVFAAVTGKYEKTEKLA